MGEQYFKGVLAGYLGANFMCGPITEWQIDIIKENISKQSLEVYIQGVKDEMKAAGRMK